MTPSPGVWSKAISPSNLRKAKAMLTEKEAQNLWQRLFRGQPITALTLTEAGAVLDDLPDDSPVRVRLSTELEEIRRLQQG